DRTLDSMAERFRAYAGMAFVTATAAAGPVDATDGDPMKLAQRRAEALAARLPLAGGPGAFDPRFLQAAGRIVAPPEAMRAEIFEEGSGSLSPKGGRVLDLAALILRPLQGRVRALELVGHTAADDADREEGSALRLSLTRARAAYRRVTGPECPHALDPKLLM